MGPPPEYALTWTVKQLMLPNSTDWNRPLIRQVLPHEEERILCLKPSQTGAPDKLIWLGNISVVYTTKSGYHQALELIAPAPPAPPTSVDWKKSIWNLHTSPKLKLFLWKIFQGALPVGESLAARHMGPPQKCSRCNADESINHLFFHCDFAHNVWKLAPFSNCVDSRGLLDLSTVWTGLCNLTCLPPTGISLGPLAPWILWSLWLARNNRTFNNRDSTAEEVITKATAASSEWLQEQVKTPTPKTNLSAQPSFGPPTSATLHTDGAWRADLHLAGLGWTLKQGHHSTSHMAHCYYVSSPLMAEGLAVREALTSCIALGIRAVQCKSDSLHLIRAINE